jgi:hypothetical protein
VARAAVLTWAMALFGLAGAYQVKGNLDLIWGTEPSSAIDLRNRDIEQSYFLQGRNPFDYFDGSQPPWGYPVGVAMTWPEWPVVRAYFAVLNVIALAFLMAWAYAESRDAPVAARLLLMAAVAAFGGSCTATEVGQISIIVTALLAGALWCDHRNHSYWCGLLVGLALIKPTISAPFAIALVIAGRFRAAAAAAGYAAAATAVTWTVTGDSPLRMLEQMAAGAAKYVDAGTLGVMDALAAFGVVSSAQVAMTPLVVSVPALAVMWLHRHSLTLAFAVAAVWGRLWTYHKSYDDVMLALVLVPLGVVAFTTRSRSVWAAFAALGAVSWIPGRLLALTPVQLLQLAIWPVALMALVAASRLRVAPAPSPASERLERLHA